MSILFDLPWGTFDLHTHTTASDGEYPPAQLVVKAKQASLSTIAITDHDTLAGIEEAQQSGEHEGIRVIPGVEITTRFLGSSVDVLGYAFDHPSRLHQKLTAYREGRRIRAERILEKLDQLGMKLSMEEVLVYSADGVIARPHIAKALVQKGYAPDVQTVFDLYLADGQPAHIEKQSLSTEAGIHLIHQEGGKAVLAHPGLIRDDRCLADLLKMNWDGIEVWHPAHTSDQARLFYHLAQERGLAVTGGSDFHNDERRLGCFGKDMISPDAK
ncbi:PHP domain-containing protein [Polycladomyces subterraneus]|uniref:PHP domain-containing protein n=1 Tax=Polycladomyces subterraneus TaxID=1016997 RepID=A0ABT8IS57_9BACL|nr:PHP domain-containing protein [Polycladomyces subterraneus]MDN4595291.1 PHP domain-containing protein [Polycladomyces subterraneus]